MVVAVASGYTTGVAGLENSNGCRGGERIGWLYTVGGTVDKRTLSYRKSRQMQQAKKASREVSRFFRRVRIGDEIDMGDIYEIAHRIEKVGLALEETARETQKMDMGDKVFEAISNTVYRLQIYAVELKNVAEKYFGFPVRALPVFTPTIRQDTPMIEPKKGITGLLEKMGEE